MPRIAPTLALAAGLFIAVGLWAAATPDASQAVVTQSECNATDMGQPVSWQGGACVTLNSLLIEATNNQDSTLNNISQAIATANSAWQGKILKLTGVVIAWNPNRSNTSIATLNSLKSTLAARSDVTLVEYDALVTVANTGTGTAVVEETPSQHSTETSPAQPANATAGATTEGATGGGEGTAPGGASATAGATSEPAFPSLGAGSFLQLAYGGGSIEQLTDDALEAGVRAIWIVRDGKWHAFIPGAPAFVNAGFASFFPLGLPAGISLLLSY